MFNSRSGRWIPAGVLALVLGAVGGGARAGGELDIEFDEANFDAAPGSTGPAMMSMISNPYWPLSPDATYVRSFTYLGSSDDECVVNRILVDPTVIKEDFAAPYEKIRAQVVLDREWVVELGDGESCDASIEPEDDHLTERTLDWYAQDIYANVWYFGEFSRSFGEECPGAEVPDAQAPAECFEGSWEAGQYGPDSEILGQPGIVVPGDNPTNSGLIETGTAYTQEVAEGAEDQARILRQNASLSIDEGSLQGDYSQCRVVKEWTALEPGSSVEHKWYCRDGSGLMLIEGIGGGPSEQEILVAIGMNAVGP